MSRSRRKPWEVPIQYNDDRFAEPTQEAARTEPEPAERRPRRDEVFGEDIGESSDKPGRPNLSSSIDQAPINYANRGQSKEFGVDDHDYDDEKYTEGE